MAHGAGFRKKKINSPGEVARRKRELSQPAKKKAPQRGTRVDPKAASKKLGFQRGVVKNPSKSKPSAPKKKFAPGKKITRTAPGAKKFGGNRPVLKPTGAKKFTGRAN